MTGWRDMEVPAVRRPRLGEGRLVRLVDEIRAGGRCSDEGVPDWWTPHGGSPAVREASQRALLVCAGCPVADQCLELAAGTGEEDHVWGGVALSHRLDAAEAFARVQAGQPIREQMLAEACSSAAARNLEEDYGVQWLTMPRRLRTELHQQEKARVWRLVVEGRDGGQVDRDVASWEASPFADMDLVEDAMAEAAAAEAAWAPAVVEPSVSWMPEAGREHEPAA